MSEWNEFKNGSYPRVGEVIAIKSDGGKIYRHILEVGKDGSSVYYHMLGDPGHHMVLTGEGWWKLIDSGY